MQTTRDTDTQKDSVTVWPGKSNALLNILQQAVLEKKDQITLNVSYVGAIIRPTIKVAQYIKNYRKPITQDYGKKLLQRKRV